MSAKFGFPTFSSPVQIPSEPDTAPDREDTHDFPRVASVPEAFELLERPGVELPLLIPPSSFKLPRVTASPRNFSDNSCIAGNALEIMDQISRIDGRHEVIDIACGGDDEIRPLIDSPSIDCNSITEVRTDACREQAAKVSIFSVSYDTARSKERRDKRIGTDLAPFSEFFLWAWGGSRYSGVVCMALSSLVYSIMGLLVDLFEVAPVPSFETIFIRCTVILVAAFIWLKKTGQPLFGWPHVRHLLLARAMVGYLSLLGFFYSIHVLPLHDAIVLNFTTPFMATIFARLILQERWAVKEIVGSLCSFLGLLLIFHPFSFFEVQRPESNVSTGLYFPGGRYYVHAFIVALLSAASGGANYCFIRAAAKASEQPLISVFAFVIFACPAAAICMFSFQKFVVPEFFHFIGMMTISVLAFLAEVLLARGLQLEKTCKATSILYIEAFASHVLGIMFLGHTPSIAGIFGGILIVTSTITIAYFGNEKVPGS